MIFQLHLVALLSALLDTLVKKLNQLQLSALFQLLFGMSRVGEC